MEEVNYNDTVVIPFLEKKCKDLLALNLVLEAKLLIEQNKVKNFESFANGENEKVEGLVNQIENLKLQHSKEITNLQSAVNTANNSVNNIQNEKNNLQNQLSDLQSKATREESLKNNAISEYHELNNKYSEMQKQLNALQNEKQIFMTQIEELKKKPSEPKQKKIQQTQVA